MNQHEWTFEDLLDLEYRATRASFAYGSRSIYTHQPAPLTPDAYVIYKNEKAISPALITHQAVQFLYDYIWTNPDA